MIYRYELCRLGAEGSAIIAEGSAIIARCWSVALWCDGVMVSLPTVCFSVPQSHPRRGQQIKTRLERTDLANGVVKEDLSDYISQQCGVMMVIVK